jgi:hypothetical protein
MHLERPGEQMSVSEGHEYSPHWVPLLCLETDSVPSSPVMSWHTRDLTKPDGEGNCVAEVRCTVCVPPGPSMVFRGPQGCPEPSIPLFDDIPEL